MSTAIAESSYQLQAEKKKLEAFLRDPASATDPAGRIAARRRLEDLPDLITATTLAEMDAAISGAEARAKEMNRQLSEARAALSEYQEQHKEEMEALQARLTEIQQGMIALYNEQANANNAATSAQQHANQSRWSKDRFMESLSRR